MSLELTRATAKIVVLPVDHYVGPRLSRRTWAASVTPRTSDAPADRTLCPHTHGHRTQDAAVKCGTQMWDRLP